MDEITLFWFRRVHHLNTLLFLTKQQELNQGEFEELVMAWEKTLTESKVIDPAEYGKTINQLVAVTKQKLESFGRRWYGKDRIFR